MTRFTVSETFQDLTFVENKFNRGCDFEVERRISQQKQMTTWKGS